MNFSFFITWLRNPRLVGSLFPSGRSLSHFMAVQADPQIPGIVIELGAGTGVVTKALLDRGFAQSRLVCVEMSDDFCAHLKQQFPQTTIAQDDAFDIPGLLKKYKVTQINSIVSSLPLLLKKEEERVAFLNRCLDALPPGQPLIQFTYQQTSPIPVTDPSVHVERTARAWMNIPPATVWTYRRVKKAS